MHLTEACLGITLMLRYHMIVIGSKETSSLKTISLTPLPSYPGQLYKQTRHVTRDQ